MSNEQLTINIDCDLGLNMKIVANLFVSLLMTVWVGAIAIFSIQNIQDVSLQFLMFHSIKLPLGVLLSFCAGAGMVLGALLPLLWQRKKRLHRSSY
ncbi:MAG: hypothetical protein Tsb0014_35870 [Pleurocapsa sp.]